jgi:hypothetical protein
MLVRDVGQELEHDPSQPKLLVSESGLGYRLDRIAQTASATN